MVRRIYPEAPIVGVGAAVFKDNEVLLIKRAKPPLQEKWTLPGGRVKENETLINATKREILEECNIEIKVQDLIDIFEYIKKDERGEIVYHYLVFDFLAVYCSGKTLPLSDALETIWVGINDLDNYEITEKAREIILKGLKMLK